LSQDNNYLAATRQGAVKVWDLRSGQRIYEQPGLDEDGNPFFNMHPAFSPDGKFLATSPHPKSITIRNVFTGEIHATLPVYYGISHWCEFSTDGKLFAHGGARILWNLGGGEANTGGGGALAICKLPANSQDWSDLIHISSDVRAIYRFHFSPNSQRIVVCGSDNQANIWDTQSGEFVFPLLGHHARINDAQYSPDGRYIVTASIDGSVKIWGAETGIELLSYNFPGSTRFDIAFFTPDGKQVVAVSEDNHYRMLAFQNFDELVNIVRGRITREWKPEERRRYLRQEVSE
jgi:WD40 repeat protein